MDSKEDKKRKRREVSFSSDQDGFYSIKLGRKMEKEEVGVLRYVGGKKTPSGDYKTFLDLIGEIQLPEGKDKYSYITTNFLFDSLGIDTAINVLREKINIESTVSPGASTAASSSLPLVLASTHNINSNYVSK